jgi:hypothetical protein
MEIKWNFNNCKIQCQRNQRQILLEKRKFPNPRCPSIPPHSFLIIQLGHLMMLRCVYGMVDLEMAQFSVFNFLVGWVDKRIKVV